MQFGLRAADPPRAIEVRPRLERAGPVALIGLAALAPLAFGTGSDVLHDMVLTAAYVVMALGLNLVVGFAGLLDLGYVAFFALGAMAVGWWASDFYTGVGGAEEG